MLKEEGNLLYRLPGVKSLGVYNCRLAVLRGENGAVALRLW